MAHRRILGAIIQNGRLYKAGDEDAFARAMEGRSVEHLIANKTLSANWSELAPVAGRIDGKPMVPGDDGLIHGDEITDGIERPPIGDDDGTMATGTADVTVHDRVLTDEEIAAATAPATPATPPTTPAKAAKPSPRKRK